MNQPDLGTIALALLAATLLFGCAGTTGVDGRLARVERMISELVETAEDDYVIELLGFPELLEEWRDHYQELEIDDDYRTRILAALDESIATFDETDLDNPAFESALIDFGGVITEAFETGVLDDTDKPGRWNKRCVKKFNRCSRNAGGDLGERRKCMKRYKKCLKKCPGKN